MVRLRGRNTPSPAGSGKLGRGGSLLGIQRVRTLMLLIEIGYLNLGDPDGVVYIAQHSVAASLSWRPGHLPVYPLASFVAANGAAAGERGYGEWGVGLAATLGDHAGLTISYSEGATVYSPRRGVTVVVARRIQGGTARNQ